MRKDGKMAPVHPGEVLREDFLKELGMSEQALARALGVAPLRIAQLVRGRSALTPDTALRLGRYFGTSAEFWVNMQAHYDLEVARDRLEARIVRSVRPRIAA